MGSRDFARYLLVATITLWASACAERSGLPALPRAEVLISRGGTQVLRLTAAVAEDDETRSRGLMHVTHLRRDEGMVFLFREPTTTPFYMKNTPLPLQLASWDAEGSIVSIISMTPCKKEPCKLYPTGEGIVGAIEVVDGVLTEAGVQIGDDVLVRRDTPPDP